MSAQPDSELWNAVLAKVRTFRPEEIADAIRLADTLPPPDGEYADSAAALIHEIALHAESVGDWGQCASLYRRAAEYRVANPHIKAGALFRYGLCEEHIGNFLEAIRSFRQALEYAQGWPALIALVRVHLARLLMAAEEWEQAAALLQELTAANAGGAVAASEGTQVPPDDIEVSLCRCLARLGNAADARARLESFCARRSDSDRQADAIQLLAGIYEEAGDTEQALECYGQLIASGSVDTQMKLAAAHRRTAILSRGYRSSKR